MPEFADSVINAFAAGRQIRDAATARARQATLDQQATDERKLQQDVLKHQLASMKLEDRLKARDIAIQSAQAQGGQPAASYRPDQIEGDVLPATGTGMAPVALKPTTVAGFSDPDLGITIPDTTVRPQTMEQALAQQMKQARVKALETDFTLKPGEKRFVPGDTPGTVQQVGSSEPDDTLPLDKQYDAAIAKGDTTTAQRLLKSIKDTKAAGRDPNAGAFVAVTEDDPDNPGQQTVRIVPRVAGTIAKRTNTDKPELPNGVMQFLGDLTRRKKPGKDPATGKTMFRPYTAADAETDVANAWPDLIKDHPRLNPVLVKGAIEKLFAQPKGAGAGTVDLKAIIASSLKGQ